jgi:hypothetical protein
MKNYSQEFKEEVVRKKLSGTPVLELSEQTGVSDVTIYKWLKDNVSSSNQINSRYPGNFTIEDKYNLLIESHSIADDEKGKWLRKNGVHSGHLTKWNEEIKQKMTTNNNDKQELKKLKEENKKLHKELKKKDKALAEAAALLVLKKKYQHLWEDEEK